MDVKISNPIKRKSHETDECVAGRFIEKRKCVSIDEFIQPIDDIIDLSVDFVTCEPYVDSAISAASCQDDDNFINELYDEMCECSFDFFSDLDDALSECEELATDFSSLKIFNYINVDDDFEDFENYNTLPAGLQGTISPGDYEVMCECYEMAKCFGIDPYTISYDDIPRM